MRLTDFQLYSARALEEPQARTKVSTSGLLFKLAFRYDSFLHGAHIRIPMRVVSRDNMRRWSIFAYVYGPVGRTMHDRPITSDTVRSDNQARGRDQAQTQTVTDGQLTVS